jgi:hypothetical protein
LRQQHVRVVEISLHVFVLVRRGGSVALASMRRNLLLTFPHIKRRGCLAARETATLDSAGKREHSCWFSVVWRIPVDLWMNIMTDTTLFISKAPKIMRQLMDEFELNEVHAAGILGNLGTECNGFHSLREIGQPEGRGGYGWAQWTGPRCKDFLDWCKKHKLDWHTDEANYGFLKFELQGSERRAISALLKTMILEDAVTTFERVFEGAGVPNLPSRIRWGRIALRAYNSAAS